MSIFKVVLLMVFFQGLLAAAESFCEPYSKAAVRVCQNSSAESASIMLLPDATDLSEDDICNCTLTHRAGYTRLSVSTIGWESTGEMFRVDGLTIYPGFRRSITFYDGSRIFYKRGRNRTTGLCLYIQVSRTDSVPDNFKVQCFAAHRLPTATTEVLTTPPVVTVNSTLSTLSSSLRTTSSWDTTLHRDEVGSTKAYAPADTENTGNGPQNLEFVVGIIGAFVAGATMALVIGYVCKRHHREKSAVVPKDNALQDFDNYINTTNTTDATADPVPEEQTVCDTPDYAAGDVSLSYEPVGAQTPHREKSVAVPNDNALQDFDNYINTTNAALQDFDNYINPTNTADTTADPAPEEHIVFNTPDYAGGDVNLSYEPVGAQTPPAYANCNNSEAHVIEQESTYYKSLEKTSTVDEAHEYSSLKY